MKLKKLLALVLCIAMVLSTIGTVAFAEDATSATVTPCYTKANSFWGEAQTYSTESLVIEIYEDETKIASASLNNIDGIIDGDVFVTWHINFDENNDEYWDVEWAEGYPKYDMNPTAVKLFADGVEVAENDVRFNAPDDLNKIVAFAEGFTGGVKAYTSLEEAVGDFNGRKVNVVRNVTESIESFNGCTLTTNVEGGVTIDNTYDDWVYANDFNIGNGVNVKAANFFYETDGVNTVEGTLEVAETLYHGYDAKTTVNNGGKIAVGGTTILRYNKTADAGIYIYGDDDDSTVEFDCGYYIGAYSGTFYAENANIEAGYYLLKNSYDNETYADVDLTLDNSSIEVVGTTDGQDSFIIDDKASVTLKNGSAIKDVRDFNILAGTDLTLDVDSESSIEATKISVAKDVPVETVDNGDGTFGVKTVIPVEVETYEELVAALAKDKSNVVMMNDITETATQNSGYGKAGVVVEAGDILDGAGHKLTINGANGTWDCAVAVKGGTVKNLTVAKAFRGIFMPGANGDVVIDNCKFDNVCYTFNSDAGSKEYGVTIKNTVLNGWTSFSDVHKFVTFENCTFGKDTGDYQYEFCRPYNETTFTGCEFNEGFDFDASAIGDNTLAFNECKYDGEELSTGAGVEMFYKGGNIKIDGEELNLVANPVAKIGLTTFAKLEDAFAAAVDGDTITLLVDATPTLASQRAITKASVIDLNGKTLKLTEDDLYFGTTTFKNGNIVVDSTVKPSTAVFWMFDNQTLTFDNVKLTASGVSGTYLIGLDGDNADLNLLNKSEIIVENDTALDLDIICVNASTGNDIVIDNSKVSVTNLDGRVFFRGNYTVSGNSDIDLIGITKAGFRIEAGQSLNILDTATVDIEGEPRDGGIHIVKLPATYSKSDTATVNATFNTPTASAKIDNTKFATLQSALDAANAGDIIVLECDVSEEIVIAAPAVATLAANDDAIVIDLAGKTLNGYILIQDANKNIEIKNGNIINEDSTESAIESVGTLTVTEVNITSARHAINVEGGNAEINGGNFALIQKDVLTQNVIGAENAVVIINDGVFTGPAGTTADSGAAVAAKTGSTVTINGGKFSGGKNNTIAGKGTLVVNGGMFDQDVTAYIAETSEAVDMGAYEYPYGVAPKAAGKINVALEATDNKNVYNIVLTSADEYDINEFVSAELTFKNESTTVGGSVMDYKINGYADNKTFAQEAKDAIGLGENEEQYIFSLNDGAKRLSSTDAKDGDGIIIGQVEFFGQGDIKFSVTKGEVDTTWQNTNLGRYYTTEVVAPATEATLGIENASINSNVPEVHRDVAVNVAFNHNIDTEKYWGNYQITATIKNSAMNYTETKDITIKDIKSGACVFEDVPVGYITVTLKAPGFRTYTYNTTLEETKDNGVLVLNFWNDVKKGNDEAIEKGKDKMAHNFLVGDIVMDMKVDKYDLAAVTSYYGTYGIDKAEAEKYIKYDLNRDGDIDIRDVQYVLHTMGN